MKLPPEKARDLLLLRNGACVLVKVKCSIAPALFEQDIGKVRDHEEIVWGRREGFSQEGFTLGDRELGLHHSQALERKASPNRDHGRRDSGCDEPREMTFEVSACPTLRRDHQDGTVNEAAGDVPESLDQASHHAFSNASSASP
jgi:hypothetical protein